MVIVMDRQGWYLIRAEHESAVKAAADEQKSHSCMFWHKREFLVSYVLFSEAAWQAV